ncbi:MAG: hypothetical protein JXQ30_09445 [Spirochaetes bacterium]|nr:hypothetical protein [Spirochaetota bacterium]
MVTITHDNENDLTIITCSGDLTEQELLDNLQSLYHHPPTKHNLWDFVDASVKNIPTEAVHRFVSVVKKIGSVREGGKTAVAAPTDLEYGMIRIFQTMTDLTQIPFEFRVFRSTDEARLWLLSQ